MRVFFNEPLENMMAVDTGLARSNFDVLHLTGEAGEITDQPSGDPAGHAGR